MKLTAIILAMLFTQTAFADKISDTVSSVANSKNSTLVMINLVEMPVIYTMKFNNCDYVGILWNGDENNIRNYQICNNQVKEINDVSPTWDEKTGQQTLQSVIQNAKNYGTSQDNDNNGYFISAKRLNTGYSKCSNYEIIIAYNGLLVKQSYISDCN